MDDYIHVDVVFHAQAHFRAGLGNGDLILPEYHIVTGRLFNHHVLDIFLGFVGVRKPSRQFIEIVLELIIVPIRRNQAPGNVDQGRHDQ